MRISFLKSNYEPQLNKYNKQSKPISSKYAVEAFGVTKNYIDPLVFRGYYGDKQPVKKMYWHLTGQSKTYQDMWTKDNLWQCNGKNWINSSPDIILKRNAGETINSILTIACKNDIPSYIPTPQVMGDNWGRYANYIEINPRLIAKYENGKISDGLLQIMKLMTAIPPSSATKPNCLILSQLYPSLKGDGSTIDETLYHTNLHSGISKNLPARGLDFKMGDDEQVKAFNDLAHLLGFKTGFRMPISSGQLRIKGNEFLWHRDEKAFIDACVWAIELGFDAIYFDSAKHIIDMDGYCGIGDVPNKEQMAYILYKIREQTQKTDLSFIGEKCLPDENYKKMGFTAGTNWGDAFDIENIKWEAEKQSHSHNYACGPEVSNDNDYGELNFENRLKRLETCLFGYQDSYSKLPTFMQINDIFPLNSKINTHQAMTNVIKMEDSNAWTECERHWDSVFRTDNDARNYTQQVYKMFENAY